MSPAALVEPSNLRHAGVVDASLGITLGMVGVISAASLWGAKVVPSGTRFPIRFGGLGYQSTISKTTALLLWPVTAALVAGGVATAGGDSDATLYVLGFLALAILLISQLASISKAAR